ncbi:hypothetical protein BD779DRAFT_1038937 [Infundibulicybe gibba]|nr:hypothetical protein BD779DRAFT_1038937 [Infundibulicybe gibba]
MTREDSRADGTSESEAGYVTHHISAKPIYRLPNSYSDCSGDVRKFWDNLIDSRIDHIGRAPSPQRCSSVTTIEALDEEQRSLESAMEAIQYRCANEQRAMQSALVALSEHLEREKRAIVQYIATIHRRRNFLAPMMRLPPEICLGSSYSMHK